MRWVSRIAGRIRAFLADALEDLRHEIRQKVAHVLGCLADLLMAIVSDDEPDEGAGPSEAPAPAGLTRREDEPVEPIVGQSATHGRFLVGRDGIHWLDDLGSSPRRKKGAGPDATSSEG
jgi:hypothetical protein